MPARIFSLFCHGRRLNRFVYPLNERIINFFHEKNKILDNRLKCVITAAE